MNRHLKVEPVSDAALFDMLHGLFGVGDFDETEMWFEHRMREIAKLKTIRKKRGVSLADFALAARYCFTHKVAIRESYQLCTYVPDAKREKRQALPSSLSVEIASAVAAERGKSKPNQGVIDRLLRARATGRRVILDELGESADGA